MTEAQAIGFYHSLQRFGVQPGLERISALCGLLGDPQHGLTFIHVAGTNGKGSTCTEIASVLSAAGYKTGLYTSPYVISFNERIRLNGEMISGVRLADVTFRVQEAVRRLNSTNVFPTEFEAVTAAAFLYFYEERCDAVVLEVGLGGRFDATNVIEHPIVSLITSISLDHTAVLGDSLAAIAAEKCGIIKPGCPVVTSAAQKQEAMRVIRHISEERNAPLYVSSAETDFTVLTETLSGTDVLYAGEPLRIPFCGFHQLDNAALALCAIGILRERGFRISRQAITEGFERARIPARTELLCKDPVVLLDGSHNEGSTGALAEVLARFYPNGGLIGVMGVMADKDTDAILGHLLPYFDKVITVTPSNPRAMSAKTLADKIAGYGKNVDFTEDPRFGIDKAINQMYHYNALIICGSLYLASDIRQYTLNRLNNKCV